MKATRILLLALAACLSGCFDISDELEIRADGSGVVRLETRTELSSEFLQSMGMMAGGNEGPVIYPPLRKEGLDKFFPAKDFTVSVTETSGVLRVVAEFKDVNALLASPYGRAHALVVRNQDGKLTVEALSGAEAMARFSEVKADTEAMQHVPNLAELQKKKDKMRAQFRVVLPNTASATNGVADGKRVTWLTERAAFKDTDAFADELGRVLVAACANDGVNFKPTNSLRLNLTSFAGLSAVSTADSSAIPDSSAVATAAKFVPCALKVQRSIDLSGEAGVGRENSAELYGLIEVPPQHAPQKWGKVTLDEATDCDGNSLKSEGRSAYGRFGVHGERLSHTEYGTTGTTATKPKHQHLATVSFLPPAWKCEEIAHIAGTIELHYGSGSRLFKLSNAIPANWIAAGEDFEAREKLLGSPELRQAGLSLRLDMAMEQNGATMLVLSGAENKAEMLNLQVFDSTGRPWPTLMSASDGEESHSHNVILPGKPKPPLSLAILVNSSSSSVRVPIKLENFRIHGDEPKLLKEPLDPRDLYRGRNVPTSEWADVPVTDAAPGFVVEALGLAVSSMALFPDGEAHLPKSYLAQTRPGTLVAVKLFAPRGRTMRGVTGARVIEAIDNKQRPIPSSDAGNISDMSSYSAHSRETGSAQLFLSLAAPPFDADAIERLKAEAVATTIGKWKELLVTNLTQNTEHDLSALVPGAALVLKKVDAKNQQVTIEADLKGPRSIRQLDLQCRLAGVKNVNSHASDRQSTDTSRSVYLMLYSYTAGGDISLDHVTLAVRYPEDVRRERVRFTLEALDIF